MSLIVLDTDVTSASLRNRLLDRLRAALAGHTMCITFVTVGELMKWRVLRNWGPNRTADLARRRQHVGVLAYDEAAAVRVSGNQGFPGRAGTTGRKAGAADRLDAGDRRQLVRRARRDTGRTVRAWRPAARLADTQPQLLGTAPSP